MRRLLCSIAIMACFAGCEMNFRPGAESIFDAMNAGPTPAEMVVMATNEYDANERYLGTLGLANEAFAGEPIYIQLFKDNLKDAEPGVRAASVRGLANHGEPSVMPLLIAALADPETIVRIEAARGLQRLHDPAAVDPLLRALHEPDARIPDDRGELQPYVRTESALALGQYAEPRVLQGLMAALDDSELSVNNAALSSLRSLTGQDLGLNTAAWVEWLGRTKEPFAARGLYVYPVFNRSLRWYEYFPFVPKPRNEVAAPPAGLPRG